MTGLSKVTPSDNSIGTLGFLCPSPPERIHTHLKKRILFPERLASMIRECSCEVISYFVRKGFVFVAVFQTEGRLSFPATAPARVWLASPQGGCSGALLQPPVSEPVSWVIWLVPGVSLLGWPQGPSHPSTNVLVISPSTSWCPARRHEGNMAQVGVSRFHCLTAWR